MKSFISSLILTGALWVSIPMSAQRPMNERVHDKVATKEAPRIQFVGKKQGPNLFQSAAASVTADFSCQSAGSAITGKRILTTEQMAGHLPMPRIFRGL